MGYRISYQNIGNIPKSRSGERKKLVLILSAVALCLGVLIAGRNTLLQWILPGDPEVTGRALETIIQSLQNGTQFQDALTAFCREIIAYGFS